MSESVKVPFERDGYVSPVRVLEPSRAADTGLQVCGRDDYGHFQEDLPAQSDLALEAMARRAALDAKLQETFDKAAR